MPQEFDPLPFQIDHIIARKHRGGTRLENLALAYFAYNNHKGPNIAGIDPDTHIVTPLFHLLNLPRRVALRHALMEEGVFPLP
jgi:HNH endonuclease